jgi:serine/threonine-protein kinase
LLAEEPRYGCGACRAVFRSGFARCPLDGTPLQQLAADPLVETIFADRYVIEACIGEGGMGRVYRARHRRVSRRFAIKVLYGEYASNGKMRERLAREAELASRLSHPNLISVVDFGESEQGLLYLVMDYVEGQELARLIDGEGPLAPPRVRRLLLQLCHGLAHAHAQGLVHRDFKAENVLVCGQGAEESARIVDFGLAFLFDSDDSERLTTAGIVMGTPSYMSPEQASGEPIDLRSDLFSLGVVLYGMLAGVLPFSGSPVEVARQNLMAAPPRIAQRVPGLQVPPALEDIAHRLMAKKPAERFQSAQEVIAAIEALPDELGAALAPVTSAPGVPVAAPLPAAAPDSEPSVVRDTVIQPVSAAVRRRRWLVGALALATLGLAAVALSRRQAGPGRSGGTAAAPASPPVSAPPGSVVSGAGAGAVAAAVAPEAVAPAPIEQPSSVAPLSDHTPARAATGHGATGRGRRRGGTPAAAQSGSTDAPASGRDVAARAGAPADAVSPVPGGTREPPSSASLQRRYVAVGEAIERLARSRRSAPVNALRDEYLRIPLADALRTPTLRAEVNRKLLRLQQRIDHALGAVP